jgi:hypothetical protein
MGLLNLLFGSSATDSSPSVNVDGTPMCGSIDLHGNPYGVIDSSDCSSSMLDDSFSSMDSSCGFDDSFSSFDDSSCDGFDDF